MKRLFLVSLILLMLISSPIIVLAEDSTSNYEDEYQYTITNGSCHIEAYWYRLDGSVKEVVIPGKIEGYPVVSLGEYAFYECDSIERIVIPDSVTSIGNRAFYGCDNLKEINIPDGVTRIGWGTFYDCKNLRQIQMSENITEIQAFAFCNCISLKELYLPISVVSIASGAFIGTYADGPYAVDLEIHGYVGSYVEEYVRRKEGLSDEEIWRNFPDLAHVTFVPINGTMNSKACSEHQFAFISYVNNSGEWKDCGNGYHLRTSVIKNYACSVCGYEKQVREAEQDAIPEPHTYNNSIERYEVTDTQHRLIVERTCSAPLCGFKNIEVGEWENHLISQNKCLTCKMENISEVFDVWYRFANGTDQIVKEPIIVDIDQVNYITIWAKSNSIFADPYNTNSRYKYKLEGDTEAICFIPEFYGFEIKQTGRVNVQIWDSLTNELLCSAIVHVVDEKDRIALVASSGTSGWMHVNNNSVIAIKAASPEQLLKFELYANEEGAIVRKTIGVDDYSNDGYKMRVTKKHGDAIWNLDEIGALLTQSYEDQLYTLELLSNISGKEKTILSFSVDITADQRLKGDRYRFMYENLYSSYSQNMGKDIIIRFDSNIFSSIDNDLLPVISIFDKLYNRILPIKGPGIDVYVDKSLSTGRIFELDETGILKPLSAGRVLIKLKMNGQQQNDYINVYGVKKLVDSSSIKIGINRPKNGEVYERIDELELQFRDVPDFTQNSDFEFGYMIQYTEGKNAGETEFIHVGTWSATNKKVTRIQLDYYDRVVVSGFIVSKHNPDFYYIGDAYTMDTYARKSWDDQCKTDSKRRSEVIIDNINHLNANNLYVMDLMDNFSIVAEMTVSMAETLKNYVDEGEYDFWKTVGIAMELDNYVDEIRTEIIGSTLKCVLNIDGKVIDFAVNEVKFWRTFQESPSVMGFVEHSLTYGQEYVESQLGFKLKIISRDGQLYIADEDETALLDLGSSVAYDDYQEIKDYMDKGSFVSQTIPGYFEIDSPLNLVTEIIDESLPGTIPIF